MKSRIFNQYVEEVCRRFDIDTELLFTKTKRREVVDARHMLYYLCHKRPMRVSYIQEKMSEMGYDIAHSSIIHGIDVFRKKARKDSDYSTILKKIKNEVHP